MTLIASMFDILWFYGIPVIILPIVAIVLSLIAIETLRGYISRSEDVGPPSVVMWSIAALIALAASVWALVHWLSSMSGTV